MNYTAFEFGRKYFYVSLFLSAARWSRTADHGLASPLTYPLDQKACYT
jgi:hypothetical protein